MKFYLASIVGATLRRYKEEIDSFGDMVSKVDGCVEEGFYDTVEDAIRDDDPLLQVELKNDEDFNKLANAFDNDLIIDKSFRVIKTDGSWSDKTNQLAIVIHDDWYE